MLWGSKGGVGEVGAVVAMVILLGKRRAIGKIWGAV